MIRFKYEALLTRQEDYFDWVFADIARIWGRMLYAGATSFWETEDGADAFDQAGSLCRAAYGRLLWQRPYAGGNDPC